jgi:hypothetical protein
MARVHDHLAEFRARAEELRLKAAIVQDEKHREILLKCAAAYEKLADHYAKAAAQGGTFKPPRPKRSISN